MSTADLLVKQMFSWIDQRELCAEQLKKLAEELESLREKCNVSDCVGSSVSVIGAAALLGAGFATLFTGGAAAPLLGLAGGVCSGAGLTVSVVTKITEQFSSSDTMKEAEEIEKKNNEITEKIQEMFEKLKVEVMEGSSLTDPDEVERCIMAEILRAVARRSGVDQQIDLSNLISTTFLAGPEDMRLNQSSFNEATVGLIRILAFFTFKVTGKKCKKLFAKATGQLIKLISTTGAKGAKKLSKEMSKLGLKTALKGGTKVVGGAVGLAFELPEAIDNWKDLINNNHVTEASQSLRDTADEILQTCRTLRKQFDDMKQTLENVAHVKHCIENSNRSSEDKKKFKKIVTEIAGDEVIVKWLRENSESRLLQLVDMFRFLITELDKQKEKIDREDIDIIFVAHGCIEESMIPASCLLPLPSIRDVLLYSPWNCVINANVAYGVATGRIQPQHRVFICRKNVCQIPDEQHQPENLPENWNSMKKAEGQKIPNIIVSTLRKPEDGAWKHFEFLQDEHGQPGRNRIVIPFILPEEMRVPFFVITFVLPLVLLCAGFKATLHLTTCLGKRSEKTTLPVDDLKAQYAYTINKTAMTTSEEMFLNEETDLYRAFKAVFG